MPVPNELREILEPAYGPCPEFNDACSKMPNDPARGHVPRGFAGAAGDVSEVELILVGSEPGNPYADERPTGLDSAYEYTVSQIRGSFFAW